MSSYNYLLRLSFVGKDFHGWQYQPHLRTVQGELQRALKTILGEEVKVIGCCRTDAGVHARDYIANFKTSKKIDEEKLLRALNGILPKDVGVFKVSLVPKDFNARRDVDYKVYTYQILNAPYRDPFLEDFCLRLPVKLKGDKLKRICELLKGEHDFRAFAKLEGKRRTQIHLQTSLEMEGELIRINFKAKSFLRYMVRRLVGLILYYCLDKVSLEEVKELLKGRGHFPYTAKAKGLTLKEVAIAKKFT